MKKTNWNKLGTTQHFGSNVMMCFAGIEFALRVLSLQTGHI